MQRMVCKPNLKSEFENDVRYSVGFRLLKIPTCRRMNPRDFNLILAAATIGSLCSIHPSSVHNHHVQFLETFIQSCLRQLREAFSIFVSIVLAWRWRCAVLLIAVLDCGIRSSLEKLCSPCLKKLDRADCAYCLKPYHVLERYSSLVHVLCVWHPSSIDPNLFASIAAGRSQNLSTMCR